MNEAELKSLVHEIREVLTPDLQASGAVFYSGPQALMACSPYYLMGLNPGGSPEKQKWENIEASLSHWEARIGNDKPWSEYLDGVWSDDEDPVNAGKSQHQINIQYLCESILQCDINSVFAANAIFPRGVPDSFGHDLLSRSWVVHSRLLKAVQPKFLLCLGNDSKSSFELARRWLQETAEVIKPVEVCGLKGDRRVFIRWFDSNSSMRILGRDKPLRVVGLPHPSYHWYEKLPGINEKIKGLIMGF